jgi:hypothetical protein
MDVTSSPPRWEGGVKVKVSEGEDRRDTLKESAPEEA